MPEALLAIQGVIAGYGYGDILNGVDLDVPPGAVTCVIGPNGAGKSTLLRAVSGLLKPRTGSIHLKQQAISGLSPQAILTAGIVQVPQDRSLFPSMTVHENVLMGGYIIRERKLLRERLEAVSARFPVVAQMHSKKAGALSGGQQRIVEIARAMMLDPSLVLLDEPSLGLDPRSRRLVFETVRSMKEEGRTILMVEQNARSGLAAADFGAVMDLGSVRLAGAAKDLLNDPEVGRLYLGSSAAHHRRPPHTEHART